MSKIPVKKGKVLKIYTDGAARGNPGPVAYAFLFVYNNDIILQGFCYIGTATNNTAEYKVIINLLKAAEMFHRGHI